MKESLLYTVTGKAVTHIGSCDLYVFVLPTKENGLATEMFAGKVAQRISQDPTQAKFIKCSSSPTIAPSVSGMPTDIGGLFASTTFSVRDGTILKVTAKHRSGFRSNLTSATMFIRMRQSAGSKSLKLRPTGLADVTFNYLEVMGAFDFINVDEAESSGCRITQATRALATRKNTEGLIEVEHLSEDSEPPLSATMVEGSDEPLMQIQRRRVIDGL